MKNSDQKKEIKKLEKNIERLKKCLNPFYKNFSITDKEKILEEIVIINEKITKLKQVLLDNNHENLNQFENESLKFNINELEISTEEQYLSDSTFLLPADDIRNINLEKENEDEEIIKMKYGNNCCPCAIL